MGRFILATFLGIFLASSAHAHGGNHHHGKPHNGEVASVTNDEFTLKDGTRVTMSTDTRLEEGPDGRSADRKALKKGSHVAVFGTTLADGTVAAKEVHIGAEGEPAEDHHINAPGNTTPTGLGHSNHDAAPDGNDQSAH